MKKRFAIINPILIAAVLFSMLFQSVDAIGHLSNRFSEKQCHHSYDTGKHQITHQHHNFDHCYVCEFAFASFISPETFSFQFHFAHKAIPYFIATPETPDAFSGSSYSLRGPPKFYCIADCSSF